MLEPSCLTCDVAVVGAGLGGLSAAVRAAESGARVVLCEARSELGGTAIFSGGGIHIWGARTWEEYRGHVPLADPRLARTLFDNFRPYTDWLAATGATGAYGTSTLRGLTLTKYQVGNSIAPAGKRRWFRHLGGRLTALGGTLMTRTRVTVLTRRGGRVTGLVAVRDGAAIELEAGSVILAAGGFQSNPQLLAEHVGAPAGRCVTRAVTEDVGDGLALALSAGAAATASMETLYGHLMPAPPCRVGWTNHLDPMLLSAYYAEHSVVLNPRGERFADEGAGELSGETVNAAARQPEGGLWIVFDESIRRGHVRYEIPDNLLRPSSLRYGWLLRYMGWRRERGRLVVYIDSLRLARDRGATVLQAPTLEDLARRLGERGVDGERALGTIREFNEHALRGAAAELAVPRTESAHPLIAAPYYAVAAVVGVSMTYGGVAIDDLARALDGEGRPVPGLYAVPGTAGGVHQLHYGGALAACGVFGMLAGADAAAMRHAEAAPLAARSRP
jgi:succinate dehydrogenase/fumarate reductase flavoprotein subunit